MIFDFNERVIWDSGSGYEIGLYLEADNSQYYHDVIDIHSGRICEPTSIMRDEIFPYSSELIEKLTKKYGYEKKFSTIF